MNHDPLEEFFARERDDIRELPGGPDHWDEIVRESRRRPARHSRLPYLAGAAAAVVVVGALVWGTGHGPSVDRAANPASRTSTTSTVSGTRTPPPSVTAPHRSSQVSSSPEPSSTVGTSPLPVPLTFSLVSMTNAGGHHLFALGAAQCDGKPCTAVIASDDDGRTWSTRASFTELTTPGSRSTPDRPNQLIGIRFANDQVGYVFGSTVRRTTDGGKSWSDVDVDRRTVLSLETDGSQVWMATARSCVHNVEAANRRGCADLQVRSGSVSDLDTLPVAVPRITGVAENAWIAMDGAEAYLNVTGPSLLQPGAAVRLSGTPAALATANGCDPAHGMWVSATANSRGTLLAVCPSAGKPEDEYAVAVSTDRGATWSVRPAPGLGRPGGAGVWLTASDARHLVAVRQGLPSSSGRTTQPTGLLVSRDGGATWRKPGTSGTDTTAWAGAAGGGLVYAFAGGTSYWASNDAGATFETVPLRK
jgi:hypothetical protein